MAKKPVVHLLSRQHCHLCDQALSLWYEVSESACWNLKIVNIEQNLSLLAQYRHKIPVFRQIEQNKEINWPITPAELHQFLNGLTLVK